jgi:hypothetical protein
VAGRCGRGDVEGEVFVQSFTPFSPSIQLNSPPRRWPAASAKTSPPAPPSASPPPLPWKNPTAPTVFSSCSRRATCSSSAATLRPSWKSSPFRRT